MGITIIGLVPLEIHLAAFMFARTARTSVTEPSVADLLAWNKKIGFARVGCCHNGTFKMPKY
jgi:hypothetical protein